MKNFGFTKAQWEKTQKETDRMVQAFALAEKLDPRFPHAIVHFTASGQHEKVKELTDFAYSLLPPTATPSQPSQPKKLGYGEILALWSVPVGYVAFMYMLIH